MSLQTELSQRLKKLKIEESRLEKFVYDNNNVRNKRPLRQQRIELNKIRLVIKETNAALWGIAKYELKNILEDKSPCAAKEN